MARTGQSAHQRCPTGGDPFFENGMASEIPNGSKASRLSKPSKSSLDAIQHTRSDEVIRTGEDMLGARGRHVPVGRSFRPDLKATGWL